LFFLFFFQAEDGIRDFHVTGVQTCALPISRYHSLALGRDCVIGGGGGAQTPRFCWAWSLLKNRAIPATPMTNVKETARKISCPRSEERRVGNECRARWELYDAERKEQ